MSKTYIFKEFPDTSVDDPFVVSTEALCDVIDEYIANHRKEHPRLGGSLNFQGKEGDIQYSGITYIADEAELTVESIARVRKRQTKHTSFFLAERILLAMGKTYLLQSACAPIRNPTWSEERWNAWKEQQENESP